MKKLILISFFILFTILCIGTILQTSPICDEVAHHLASGYSYLKTKDFRMNPATPAFSRELIAASLLVLNLRLPTDHPSWINNDSPIFGRLFLYEYNDNPERIVLLARLSVMLQSIILAFLVYVWARKVHGVNAAVFSVFLYLFSPAIIGNSTIAMADISVSLFIFLTIFQFWLFLQKKTIAGLIFTGIFFGLAQSSKHTAIILFPLFIILGIVYAMNSSNNKGDMLWDMWKKIVLIWGIGFFTLWATYFFEFKPLLLNVSDINEKVVYIQRFLSSIPFLDHKYIIDKVIYFAKNVPIPLSSFFISLFGVLHQSSIGQGVFFMGEHTISGSRIYYIVDYLIKTPIPLLIFIILSIFLTLFKRLFKTKILTNWFIILPIFLIFVASSYSKIQGGIRYLLPIYPFLFVWLGNIITVKFNPFRNLFYKIIILIICLWYFWIALKTFPDYLCYFNEAVGGLNGFGHKITHDCDWGQDLKALGKFYKKNDLNEITLSYFGTADPSFYGINYKELSKEEQDVPGKKVYAISIRFLDSAKWTRNIPPSAKAGHSIFIYDFRVN
ncbi:MAG: glycosyltransferase family 39 protein [Patescibacteria group bacterium]